MVIFCQIASAQKPQTTEGIDSLSQKAKETALETFRNDSINAINKLITKRDKTIASIEKKANQQKTKLEQGKNKPLNILNKGNNKDAKEKNNQKGKDRKKVKQPNPNTAPQHDENQAKGITAVPIEKQPKEQTTDNAAVKSLKAMCVEHLTNLKGRDEMNSTNKFLCDFLKMNDDIGMYIQIKDDLEEVYNICLQRGLVVTELRLFISDLQTIMHADAVLGISYKKQNIIDAQKRIETIKSFTEKQKKCHYVDAICLGLKRYYLATSNMLDLIQQIEDYSEQYNKYIEKYKDAGFETDEAQSEKNEIFEGLKSEIEFEARIENFRRVKFMSEMYDQIVNEILHNDENGNFALNEFDMKKLKEIKDNLEKMRQQ